MRIDDAESKKNVLSLTWDLAWTLLLPPAHFPTGAGGRATGPTEIGTSTQAGLGTLPAALLNPSGYGLLPRLILSPDRAGMPLVRYNATLGAPHMPEASPSSRLLGMTPSRRRV
ncbi:hypothetical protein PGT21_004931 [Puccinia graminis f. sp. tritici]|uniref:Uncharacterized protein n=1 Tax=Puccinia graminis f. sp. tritici TaxID=56615 RepID=A0A5B0LYU7_PUCGR|nr:hypothetical protein PGT21_004931 [Puccinia graminis f. sp. tritici]